QHEAAASVAAMARLQQGLLDAEGARGQRQAAPGSAEDIAELVFRLRDQRTPVMVQPGDDYLLARAEPDPSPAGQLQARGLRAVRSLAVRARLLSALARLGGAEVTPFLQDELVHGNYLETQVMAAGALLDRGQREGLELMLRAWTTDEDRVDPKTLEPAVR